MLVCCMGSCPGCPYGTDPDGRKARSSGVVVISPDFHSGDHGFESHLDYVAKPWMSEEDKKQAAEALAKAKPPKLPPDEDEPEHPVIKTGKGLTD